MKSRLKLFTLIASFVALNACDTATGNYVGVPCEVDEQCLGLVCVNYVCIEKCSPDTCLAGQICNSRGVCETPAKPAECSNSNPCTDPQKECKEGVCVDITPEKPAECSKSNPCSDPQKECKEGVCVDITPEKPAECSNSNPCTDPQKECKEGVCVDITPETDKSCDADHPCSNPYQVCDTASSTCIDRCTATSCTDGKICGNDGLCVEKCTADSCGPDALCINGFCIGKCTPDDCQPGEFCGADGVCTAKCTPTSCPDQQYCAADGSCQLKCSAKSCPDSQVCGESGSCIDAECSEIDPCQNNQICSLGKCYTVQTLICYSDADCGEGMGCDNNQCVDANSCSMTRTCPEGKNCRNGQCVEPDAMPCDAKHPCADSTKTCVAGECVACSCNADEICVGEQKCIPANKTDRYTVGDTCTWSKEFTHCDNNRLVTCTSEVGSDIHTVNIHDCGAGICTSTSDGLGPSCHEPCNYENDFFGICLDVFSEINEFTKICEKTSDDKLVWTLTDGFKTCQSGCTNGRCDFTPKEFGENCTAKDYPDACQGQWLTYCFNGYKLGTDCRTYSDEHFCALPSADALKREPELIGVCATKCTTPGATRKGCIKDEDGNVFSMNYLCAETTTGILAEFEAGYIACEKGCNIESGLCI